MSDGVAKNKHIGSTFDAFLKEESIDVSEVDEMERLFKLAVEKNRQSSEGIVNEAEKLARSARQSSAGIPAVPRPKKPGTGEGLTAKFAAIRK